MEKNTELLGEFRGRFYSITRKVEPSFQSVDKFSVSIHFTDPETGEEVEVVRIDNSHGFVHMDRLFEEEQSKEEMPGHDTFTAYDYLKNNWKRYAEKFED
jgi:hypothetical protein